MRRVKVADGAFHQQFRAFAQVCQRRFQFMRHMAQEAVFFFLQFHQPRAQPFQLLSKLLQVRRASDGDGRIELAATEFGDGPVNLLQRPYQQHDKQQGEERSDRDQCGGLQQQLLLGGFGSRLQRCEFIAGLQGVGCRQVVGGQNHGLEVP